MQLLSFKGARSIVMQVIKADRRNIVLVAPTNKLVIALSTEESKPSEGYYNINVYLNTTECGWRGKKEDFEKEVAYLIQYAIKHTPKEDWGKEWGGYALVVGEGQTPTTDVEWRLSEYENPKATVTLVTGFALECARNNKDIVYPTKELACSWVDRGRGNVAYERATDKQALTEFENAFKKWQETGEVAYGYKPRFEAYLGYKI